MDRERWFLYNTATAELGEDRRMTQSEKNAANAQLRAEGSDCRWIEYDFQAVNDEVE